MRALLVLLTLPLAVLLAGCATGPSPVGDAEAAHAGVSCPPGAFVASFNGAGAPTCAAPATAAAPFAGFSCPEGEVLVGFDAAGTPRCRPIMEVAEAAMAKERPAQGNATPSQPARTLSITSNGAIQDGVKRYTLAAASSGMRWSDLAVTVNGQPFRLDAEGTCPSTASGAGRYLVCGPARERGQDTVDAGDALTFAGVSSGQTMRFLDPQANSVILTLTIG